MIMMMISLMKMIQIFWWVNDHFFLLIVRLILNNKMEMLNVNCGRLRAQYFYFILFYFIYIYFFLQDLLYCIHFIHGYFI